MAAYEEFIFQGAGQTQASAGITWQGSLDDEKVEKKELAKIMCKKRILELWPEYKQTNAALGLLEQEEHTQLVIDLQALRVRYADFKAAIDAAQNYAELGLINITYNDIRPDSPPPEVQAMQNIIGG